MVRPEEIQHCSASRLAGLLGPLHDPDEHPDPEAVGRRLRDRLDARIDFDLAGMAPEARRALTEAPAADTLIRGRLGDLLLHTQPPVALLELVKDYAKTWCQAGEDATERQVDAVIYLACIAVARLRCGRRITRLDDETLAATLSRTRRVAWLTPELRALFTQSQAKLSAEGRDAHG